MIARFAALALNLFLLTGSVTASTDNHSQNSGTRNLMGARSNSCRRREKLTLKITNLSRAQPFASQFFVMIHNHHAPPLFEFQKKASKELQFLAEFGDASMLVDFYNNPNNLESHDAVQYVGTAGPSFPREEPLYIDIDALSNRHPYVTIAAMFVNSNDGFCAINGKMVDDGDVLYLNGLDAGTEVNDELCENIPGPACRDIDTNNGGTPEGGVVHVHPGFNGIGTEELTPARYDWRNPMLQVEVLCIEEDDLPESK